MIRKIVAVWISLVMLFGFIVIIDTSIDFIPTVKGTTIYVNESGSGGAYTSIQDAINDSKDGDTVFVFNGTYFENVVVNKTINLTGESTHSTIINGSDSGDVVRIDVNWVNITGFSITNSGGSAGDSGIELNSVQNCSIYNTIVLTSWYGIYLWFSNENYLLNNTISSNGYSGFYLRYSQKNNITYNNVSACQTGIYLMDSNENNVINNHAFFNDGGILVSESFRNNINSNIVSLNKWGGISLYDSHGNNVFDNNASWNNGLGIQMRYSSGNNITYNDATFCQDVGISLDYSDGNNITNNDFSFNGVGMEIDYSRRNNITSNIMTGDGIFILGDLLEQWTTHNIDISNTVNGNPVFYRSNQIGEIVPQGIGQVILANCTDFTIENQKLVNCTNGIILGFSSNNNITNNSISMNVRNGIYLYSSTGNVIFRNNVSNNGVGIYLSYSNMNNITENNAYNNYHGFYFWYSDSNIIIGNTASMNVGNGIYTRYSQGNTIMNNNLTLNVFDGLSLQRSDINNINNNRISSNINGGLYIVSSSGMNITDNNFIDDSILIFGDNIKYWNTHNIDTTNKVNEKPVYYLKNQTGGIVPVGAGEVILANCINIKVENQELNNGTVSIELGYSSNINVTGNNASNNDQYGILLSHSFNNNITENNFSSNVYGIYIRGSNRNYICNNEILFSKDHSMFIDGSSGIDITDNVMIEGGIAIRSTMLDEWNTHNIDTSNTVNGKPVYYWKNQTGGNIPFGVGQVILANCTEVKIEYQKLTYLSIGIALGFSSGVNITNNEILWNKNKGLYIYSSSGNNITNNTILSTEKWGIYLESSPGNHIFHNNIINNAIQAYDNRWDNIWDNGYPSGGNYWSDYSDVDMFKGPNQDTLGNDGIGDKPYVIDINSQDNYPKISSIDNFTYLYNGWNLISLPYIQSNTKIDDVLASINGSYDSVQWYNNSDSEDSWKHKYKLKPSFLNDLDNIYHTIGFWIHITELGGVPFKYSGTQPTSNQTITLHPGWNMMGYPSLTSYNRTEGLNNLTFNDQVDAIWSYDAATHKWEEMGESDYFQIGRGYYVHAKSECEWEVPL